ncbi:methyltransferase domain-containing protein [Pseudoxanthobacter sp.]|uniref:methyltransferase domain-containing protein n=1 Tax=Pseudoxanthobacter sp. TaxID=1925742 RepID=UPI002FE26794
MAASPLSRSSGDLLADRRFEYAEALLAEGDTAAAADLFRQALDLAPDWAAGWAALGGALAEAGDRPGAAEALRTAIRLDPADPYGATLKLSLVEGEAAPPAPPAAYVRALFDEYAPRFEAALLNDLGYSTPPRLAGLIARADPGRFFARMLDLGCGTGLMAAAMRDGAGRIEGVDLSAAMIAQAGARGLYESLAVNDIVRHLETVGGPYDLVTAADVLCYLGDLSPVLAGSAARLGPGGLLAFSVERAEDDLAEGWRLQASMRFAHARWYLEKVAGEAGLSVVLHEEAALRMDRGEAVMGHLMVLRRA